MKIRAITLKNVRRFQGTTARISGLADGITTICAPNEFGKSTFFDALHALFFYPHSGQPQEIKSLQPHSKGAVEISVEVEDDHGKPFRIEKKYLSSKSATITDLTTNRLVAQADEAEQWIKLLIGTEAQGPAGLLWVRQGISGFGPDGSGAKEKGEREKLREARQTLMSSVAGQIDNVTGGRRMDQIMKACEADFDALATKTGQPKAGGEWSKAVKRSEELEGEETRLSLQVAELGQALKEHAQIKATHKSHEESDATSSRKDAISKADKALSEARGHEQLILDRRRDLRLSELEAKACSDRIDADTSARALREKLDQAGKSTEKASLFAISEAAETETQLENATDNLKKVRTALQEARNALSAGRRIHDQRQKSKQRLSLKNLVDKIDAFEEDRKSHAQTLRDITIAQNDMDRINDLSHKLATAKAIKAASAATLTIKYSGDATLTDGGSQLPGNESIPLIKEMVIGIPGIGSLQLAPAHVSKKGAEEPEDIALELSTLLAKLDLDDVESARAQMQRRSEAERGDALARQSIDTLAPDGTEKIRRDLADLGDETGPDDGALVDIDTLQDRVTQCELSEQQALDLQDNARKDHDAASAVATEAKTKHSVAIEAYKNLTDKEISPADLAAIKSDLNSANKSAKNISDEIERLELAAPDTEAAEALLERLTSARDNAALEREQRLERMNTLGGVIRARAEDGVETRLEEVRGQLEKARDRAGRYKFDVDALTELRSHLEAARKEARDAYFEPVKKEIGPLLSMLHDDAVVEMDPDTMLPVRIVRDGVAEEIDTLSGGAAEQIAILTRLAFAKLYAKSGKKVPIILDDALVYSDDDRIVKMFTALTRSSKDQQIIVLSCRTRAFEELGGTRAKIEVAGSLG